MKCVSLFWHGKLAAEDSASILDVFCIECYMCVCVYTHFTLNFAVEIEILLATRTSYVFLNTVYDQDSN
jgi:hypothetical protein